MLDRVKGWLANIVDAADWFFTNARKAAAWVSARAYVRRIFLWVLVGFLGISVLMLRDISSLLGSISGSEVSYDAGVLTGPKLFFWDTIEFKDALRTWRAASSDEFNIARLTATHAALDALAFIPAYSILLGIWLRHVGGKFRFSLVLACLLFIVDEIETVTTWIVLSDLAASSFWLGFIKFFSLIKWLVIATIVVSIAALWPRPTPELPNSSNLRSNVADIRHKAKSGDEQEPGIAVSGLVFLVGVLFALVALPAGGPLEQLPDVLRNHLSEGDPALWAMSTLGLLLFAIAVTTAGLLSTTKRVPLPPAPSLATQGQGTSTGSQPVASTRDRTISTPQVIAGATILSLGLLALSCAVDGEPNPATLAPALVVAGLSVGAWLAGYARELSADEPAILRWERAWRKPVRWEESATNWVSGLAAAVIVISGLGLVRAAFVPQLLGVENDRYPWLLAIFFGCIGALSGGLIQWLLPSLFDNSWSFGRALSMLGLVELAVVGSAVWLMISPPSGRLWGSTGVIGVGFAFWALVVGTLTWASRRLPPWRALYKLGIAYRTPWGTLLVITWILASVLNTRGGYHDARVTDDLGPTPAAYTSLGTATPLKTAFDEWKSAQTGACTPDEPDRIPLVLIAAPGGGIRAAYWTAASLDRIFEEGCPRLFAISGVSGGSVGSTTWVAATSDGKKAASAVEGMSGDVALSSALSASLLRDLPQPLLGITDGWADRAAMLEDGWIETAGVFGSIDDPVTWAELLGPNVTSDLGFTPVVALNGSSVNDGCRVLVSNVADLPTSFGEDCQAAADDSVDPVGPVSGSIEAFRGLHERDAADRNCGTRDAGMRGTTAALLSARFPLISPTGALVRCIDGDTDVTTYSVDGGYYENSGILTLLEIWNGIENFVRQHNEAVMKSRTDGLTGPVIEPWIVILDNHYHSSVSQAPPGRPLETLAILRAYQQEELTQSILEQAAWFEMSSFVDLTGSSSTSNECRESPRFVRLAPSMTPDVAAPLGWVLSEASRDNLDEELTIQMQANSALGCLLEELQE